MQSIIGFDVISDLNLNPEDSFNWENKATSLYCLVAGNVSSDLRTIVQTLAHLSRYYQGVFYVPGTLEYSKHEGKIGDRTDELMAIADQLPNIVMLHHHVVIIDGVAVIGANGWNSGSTGDSLLDMAYASARLEDIAYLHKSIEKLQKHLDVKKVVVVTNAVPHDELYFKEVPQDANHQIPLHAALIGDTEHKVKCWVFGTYEKTADTFVGDINYINNPYLGRRPYWAKRITLTV